MTDEEFLGYVEIHSRTPRALFHRKHAQRLIDMSGEGTFPIEGEWITIHDDIAQPLVDAARKKQMLQEVPEASNDTFTKATAPLRSTRRGENISDKEIRDNYNLVTELASQQAHCKCATCMLLRAMHKVRTSSK